MQAFPLDDRGRRYVLDLLAEGLTLAKAVRRRLDLGSSGRCFALVEEALTEQQIYEFQWGKLMSASDGDESAAQLVRDALQAPGRLFLGESADMKADYPALKSWPPITFALHEDVYVGLDAQQAAQPLLITAVRLIDAGWTANMFVSHSRVPRSALRGEVDAAVVEELAAGVELVLVRAYDGESYVVWDLRALEGGKER